MNQKSDDLHDTLSIGSGRKGIDGGPISIRAANDVPPEIPNFVLEECIGNGGFGRIYRARRKSDNAIVAVKLLHPEGEVTDSVRVRFLREATVLCQLKHPRIVRFRELGIVDNRLYLIMDFINAVDWKIVSQNLAIPRRIKVAARIIDQCLDALVYLHQQNLVHRDLKPNNILLEKRANKLHVFLADFGLAKNYLHAGHSGVTNDMEIAGTLSYLAPELLAGVKYYRPESDQYALAATCYDMICGRPPLLISPGMNAILAIRQHVIEPIERRIPEVPDRLARWIHKGLQTNPADRFASAQAMKSELAMAIAAL